MQAFHALNTTKHADVNNDVLWMHVHDILNEKVCT